MVTLLLSTIRVGQNALSATGIMVIEIVVVMSGDKPGITVNWLTFDSFMLQMETTVIDQPGSDMQMYLFSV